MPGEVVTMRPGTRRDMAAVARMAAEFRAHLAAIDGSDPSLDVEGARRSLERFGFGPAPRFSTLIAEAAATPVGYALYSLAFWADTFQGTVFLTDLFVREGWRSRGIGRRLMDGLAAVGREHGCEIVLWTVWTRNPAAQRFYERLGATPMPEETLMRWPIARPAPAIPRAGPPSRSASAPAAARRAATAAECLNKP